MSVRRRLLLLALLPALPAVSGCANSFEFSDPGAGPPTQVAAVATTGGVDVHWSAMDEAIGYAVFISTDGDLAGELATCTGGDDSPCEIRGLTPGTLHYVRVTTVLDVEAPIDLDRVADQEVLAVRPLYTQQQGGIFAWAGFGRLELNGNIHLEGAWYEDETAPSAVHTCTVFWGGHEGESEPLEPCASADLSLDGVFNIGYRESGTYHPVLEVESEDGRFGQAFTTVVMK